MKEHRRRLLPEYPDCQDCSQYYTVQKKQKGGGYKMYPKKIDDEKLKEMVADGKFTRDIAAAFGVGKGAVGARMKVLKLPPNYERQRKGAPAPKKQKPPFSWPTRPTVTSLPTAIPVEEPVVNPQEQIIPVTLRLNVEVNVRVSAERV
jgi:hypothetical protein